MSDKPRLLCLIRYYLPGYKAGGALRSVANIVELIGDRCEIMVLTSDRDLGDDAPYSNVRMDRWQAIGKAQVRYGPVTIRELRGLLNHTVRSTLYLNSFFDFRFSILPVWLARQRTDLRVILAPRGEFTAGALQLKRLKKRLFIALARRLPAYERIEWHASTEQEAAEIQAVMGVPRHRITISKDVTLPSIDARETDVSAPRAGPLRVCFVSRVSPKKNLSAAISVVSSLAVPVTFDIVGPEEDRAYSDKCKELADQAPEHVRIRFLGSVPSHEIQGTFARYHVMLLPTLGENYGHVIAESLRAGTPVVISDTTPWRELDGGGFVVPLNDSQKMRESLEYIAKLDDKAYAEMRAAARRAFATSVDIDAIENRLMADFFR